MFLSIETVDIKKIRIKFDKLKKLKENSIKNKINFEK
jgi:hypothetical protein